MGLDVVVVSLTGRELEKIQSKIFDLTVREDLVRRAFHHIYSHNFQPKGRDPMAGKRTSAEYFGNDLGLARIPRIKGRPQRGRGAMVNMAVGGRRPHVTPPEKRIHKRLNRKERLLATAMAAAATGSLDMVAARGHVVDGISKLPLVVSDDLESISTTKEFLALAENLGLAPDLERVRKNIKMVGGKVRLRGRGKRVRKGPLIVFNEDRGVSMAVRNIPGVDLVLAKDVSVIHLAPGGAPGRLTVWSRSSLTTLEERLKDWVRRVEPLV
jgi:large subunit ribosomal protein L4e